MTKGNPLPLILRFALPLLLGNIFQQLYTVVDTMVVGKSLGVSALAALGASDWLNWLMVAMAQGLTQGFAVLMAQAFGAKETERLRRVVGVSATLCCISVLILVAGSQIAVMPVLRLMQTPGDIIHITALYLRIMYGGLPIVMAYNLFASILRSLGDSRTPLFAMIVACCVNILLDLLFVPVFHWGVAGAAAASLIAQCASAVFCLLRIRKLEDIKLRKEHYKPDWKLSWQLLRLGATLAFQFLIIAVGGLVVQFVVNGMGVIFIAGYTAASKLYGLLEIAATSFGFAVVTFVGQNLGAGRTDRIKLGQRYAYVLAIGTSVIISAIMILLGKLILGSFLSGTPQEVAETITISLRYLMVMSLCLPVLYAIYVSRSSLQGIGNAAIPVASGLVELLMRTVMVFLLPVFLGNEGVFFAEVSAWVGADLVLIPGWFFAIRKVEQRYKSVDISE